MSNLGYSSVQAPTFPNPGRACIQSLPLDGFGGLQAVDYFLWALQRMYERREERYLQYIWPKVHLVHDIDDTRLAEYGVYYTQKKPLALAAIKKVQEI